MDEIVVREPSNPLITAMDMPYQANAVFNAGAAVVNDEVLLLLRVESCSGRSHLIVARSRDGVTNWRIEDRALLHPAQGFPREENGVEDCRITWMEELESWGLAYVAYSSAGPCAALATTKDFEAVTRVGAVLPPDNKNAALFPRRFGNLYAMLHRPSASASIWLSYSPDLVYWGKPALLLPVRGGPWWDGVRVGAGPPPIETDEGWLMLYHGVRQTAAGSLYRLGAALLDLDQPRRVIGRARRWLLAPQEPYERFGDAPNVVFACGAVVRGDEIWIYYGAADCSICLAKMKITEVLALVTSEPVD